VNDIDANNKANNVTTSAMENTIHKEEIKELEFDNELIAGNSQVYENFHMDFQPSKPVGITIDEEAKQVFERNIHEQVDIENEVITIGSQESHTARQREIKGMAEFINLDKE
jgi:hypothetical protein